jgi:hypothetical protein
LNCQYVAKHCKFDARGTLVPNTSTASAPAVEIKMDVYVGAERARCVFWFEQTKSATEVQSKFRTQYHKEPPSMPTIYSWYNNFIETGCSVPHAKSPGRTCVREATVQQLRGSFVRTRGKSTRRASPETGITNNYN